MDGYSYAQFGLVEKGFDEIEGQHFHGTREAKLGRCMVCPEASYLPTGFSKHHSFGNLWAEGDTLDITVDMPKKSLKVQNSKDSSKSATVKGIPNNRFLALLKSGGGSFSVLEQSYL